MDNNNNNNKILVLNFLGQLWIHNEKKYYNNKKLTINIVKGKNKYSIYIWKKKKQNLYDIFLWLDYKIHLM